MHNNINWIKTFELYKIDQTSKSISNKKVVYKCPKCGSESHILFKSIKNRKYHECLKCISKNCEYKLKISQSSIKFYNNNPDVKTQLSINSKNNWDNIKLKMANGLNEKWKDKNFIEQKKIECIERNKIIWSENRDEHIIKIKESFTDDRLKEMSTISKSLWQDKDYKVKTINAMNEPSNIELISKTSKERWLNEDFRNKMAIVRINQPRTSFQQTVLYSILDDLNIKYYNDTNENCKLGFYCFDCRIDKQELTKITKPLLIEVQGDYWHELPKNKIKDVQKSTYVQKYFPDFDVKYLWEHEFNNKDRVINLIKYWLGIDTIKIVDFNFKDIKQKIIDNKTTELFISKYHYASRIWKNGINLGYHINDELIAVIVYNNPVRQETAIKQGYEYKEILELSRLAINPKYQVKNLASNVISKSIKFIINNHKNVKCLVSFTDTTYNHIGTVYRASNWEFDGEVNPDYWYIDERGYVCHKKTLWDKSKKMNMSESEYQVKYEYKKIYGKKKLRFIYRLC